MKREGVYKRTEMKSVTISIVDAMPVESWWRSMVGELKLQVTVSPGDCRGSDATMESDKCSFLRSLSYHLGDSKPRAEEL